MKDDDILEFTDSIKKITKLKYLDIGLSNWA